MYVEGVREDFILEIYSVRIVKKFGVYFGIGELKVKRKFKMILRFRKI